MKWYKSAAVGLGALTALSVAAYSAGYFPGWPIVDAPSYCNGSSGTGTGTGSSTFSSTTPGTQFGQGQAGQSGTFASPCYSTVPAGPNETGLELIPADTQLASGQQPQTVLMPSYLFNLNTRINRLIGGDFATNLWQRSATLFTSITPTTATMTADRWYAYSSANTVSVSKQTGAADTIPSQGLYASMRVSRPSTTNTSQICVGQVLDKNWASTLIGNNAVLSFWAMAGAGLNAVDAGNNLSVNIAYYTAADSATPGTNTGTFATGTISGYQAAVVAPSPGTTATLASGVATVPVTTSWARYGVAATIPATNASGTAVTGVGVSICYTPASGTGGATEYFEIEGVQLQAAPSSATPAMPNGGVGYTGFERRSPQTEADYQTWYSLVYTDGATTQRYAMGQAIASTQAQVILGFPALMRETPATTVNTAASFAVTTSTGVNTSCTATTVVASSNTSSSGAVACQVASGLTAGNAVEFEGQNTTGQIVFSAEP